MTPSQTDRRSQRRRSADRADAYLHKTFSTPYCHSCLERMADGVVLLDSETRVIYVTPQVDQIMKRHDQTFILAPKFTLSHPHYAACLAAFVNEKNQESGPLSLLLEGEIEGDMVLLNCIQFPEPAEPNLNAARYMITLRESNHSPSQQWQLFNKQFNLTLAEARLCSSFADGLTLYDYCKKWNVTTGTARSQLHSVFGKTSTHRQNDLLRLIILFSRS